jgi:hypothetical protein
MADKLDSNVDRDLRGAHQAGDEAGDKKASMRSINANSEVDQEITQADAVTILQRLRDEIFDSSTEKLALALGRPGEEIEQWCNGIGTIDDDVIIKAGGIAQERGVKI